MTRILLSAAAAAALLGAAPTRAEASSTTAESRKRPACCEQMAAQLHARAAQHDAAPERRVPAATSSAHPQDEDAFQRPPSYWSGP